MKDDNMHSIPQVAELLNTTRASVWNWVQNGRIDATVIPGGKRNEYRISDEAIEDFLQRKEAKQSHA